MVFGLRKSRLAMSVLATPGGDEVEHLAFAGAELGESPAQS